MLSQTLHTLANIVFPPVCEGCQTGLPFSQSVPICSSCSSKFREIIPPTCFLCARPWPGQDPCPSCKDFQPAYDRLWAALTFDETLKPIFHAYKFKHRRPLKTFFSSILCRYALTHTNMGRFDMVIAVPPNPLTFPDRGFHPALDLAKSLSRCLHVPDRSSWLGSRSGHAQVLLTKTDRLQNVKNRFYYKGPRNFSADSKVLLVDDVFTTGSTVSECSRVLKSAGAKLVTALCLARGSWQ